MSLVLSCLILRFHRLPTPSDRTRTKDKSLVHDRQKAWLNVLRRQDIRRLMYRNIRICSCHFVNGQPATLNKQQDPDWDPSVNLGYEQPIIVSFASRARSERRRRREEMREDTSIVQAVDPEDVEIADQKEISVQTDLTSTDLKGLDEDYQQRMSENLKLEEKLQSVECAFPDRGALSNNNKLVTSYTGMPCYQVLYALFRFVAPGISVTTSTKLTKFQQFVMLLMKLRMNPPLFDLAFRFKVSESTISLVFGRLIVILDKRLSPIVR